MPVTSTAEILKIADSVVEMLNGEDFSLDLTAIRRVLPRFDMEEIEEEKKLIVAPRGVTTRREGRGLAVYEYNVDVALLARLAPGSAEDAALDELLLFMEEVENFLKFKPLPDVEEAHWTESAYATTYSDEHLETRRQFTGVLTLTYELRR